LDGRAQRPQGLFAQIEGNERVAYLVASAQRLFGSAIREDDEKAISTWDDSVVRPDVAGNNPDRAFAHLLTHAWPTRASRLAHLVKTNNFDLCGLDEPTVARRRTHTFSKAFDF
jgi:hypothetical protein